MRLSVGTSVIIEKDFSEEGDRYKSKVVDITDQNNVMIDYPSHLVTNRTAFFLDGTQLYVTFVDEHKNSYAFRTEVVGRINKGIPMLKISYPGDDQLIKIQRREFVRVETPIDVAVLVDGTFEQFVAEDISAGGIALLLTAERELFVENELYSLYIVLPFLQDEIQYIQVTAELVRIWEKENRVLASFQFIDIEDLERQKIIRFCFERQLQTRNDES